MIYFTHGLLEMHAFCHWGETRMCREVFDLASSRQQKTNSATHQKDCIRYHFDGSGTISGPMIIESGLKSYFGIYLNYGYDIQGNTSFIV